MVEIAEIGVIGAGQMGAGIAQVCALAGYGVHLIDANKPALERGAQSIQKQLARLVEKEKITRSAADDGWKRIKVTENLKDLNKADLVIEAIIENVEIKCKLFQELDQLCKPETILGSNTSSISITKLAASTNRSPQVIGIHFMNPVPVMKLVEIIKGIQTSAETYTEIIKFVEKIGKTSVLGIDAPGFVVNRILCPMINEAIYLLQQGVTAPDIDTAMKLGTNHPMGPLELADFVGLDTLLYILRILHSELGEDKYRPCPLLVKYVEAGWYGRKTGRGFYQYEQG